MSDLDHEILKVRADLANAQEMIDDRSAEVRKEGIMLSKMYRRNLNRLKTKRQDLKKTLKGVW